MRVVLGALGALLAASTALAGSPFGLQHPGAGAVQAVGGNASAAVATPTGATTPRSLAAHLADTITAEDFGATGNGTTDDTSAVQSWEEYARYNKQELLTFNTNATYKLTGTVYSANGAHYSIPAGAAVIGGSLLGVTDALMINGTSGQVFASHMVNTAGNENALAVSAFMDSEAGTIGSQKNGIYTNVATSDPSQTSGGYVNKDAVGAQFSCQISAGNASGRCFGLEVQSNNTGSGAKGYRVGLEVGINSSDPSAAGAYGSTNAAIGESILATSAAPLTAGELIADANGQWQDGLLMFQGGIAGNFIRLMVKGAPTDLFHIDSTGNTVGQGATFTTVNVSNGLNVTGGNIVGAQGLSIAGNASTGALTVPAITDGGNLTASGYIDGNSNISGLTYGTIGAYLGRNVSGGGNEGDVVGVNGLSLYAVAPSTAATGNAAIKISTGNLPSFQAFAVASLPTCTAGQMAYASNGRNNGEAASAGTGLNVTCNSAGHWLAPWSGVTVTQ